MGNQLSIANVVNISVSQAQLGLGEYNVNNLAIFTNDSYAESFGSLGYQLYLDPSQVGIDFGTASETYAMANAVFSQQPNILAGGGYLAVIPFLPNEQTLGFSAVAASGTFHLNYGSEHIVVNWNDSAATIQANLRALDPVLSQVAVSGSIASQSLEFTMWGIYKPTALTISSNTLEDSGSASITIMVTQTRAYETLSAAIVRTTGLIQYFGIMATSLAQTLTSGDVLAAAATVQAQSNILFVVSNQESDIEMGGIIYTATSDEYSQTRGLYYGDTSDDGVANSLGYMAAYAGRALSTNFNGSNTTETMHLKQLIGVSPDPTMTQSILNLAGLAGADCYVSLQGVPAVFTSGQNQYFDQVYNLLWIVGALQVAGFNYLAQSSTKVPQTEAGMTGLKGAYRAVCQQGVANQYLAPGSWNSSTTFGNQVDFLSNISQFGYYIYSQPISQQSQANRAARQAPLVQIALKQAGAIQESSVVIYVNA